MSTRCLKGEAEKKGHATVTNANTHTHINTHTYTQRERERGIEERGKGVKETEGQTEREG